MTHHYSYKAYIYAGGTDSEYCNLVADHVDPVNDPNLLHSSTHLTVGDSVYLVCISFTTLHKELGINKKYVLFDIDPISFRAPVEDECNYMDVFSCSTLAIP